MKIFHFQTKSYCSTDSTTSTACSNLSRCMGAVLETGQYADMTFLIAHGSESATTNESTAAPHASNCLLAHRVVLASRCDWFRRALTSGMKESIERLGYRQSRITFWLKVYCQCRNNKIQCHEKEPLKIDKTVNFDITMAF